MSLNVYRTTERTKKVSIKHRAKIYTEALYFALKNGRE